MAFMRLPAFQLDCNFSYSLLGIETVDRIYAMGLKALRLQFLLLPIRD
jgi:hypothetical protein